MAPYAVICSAIAEEVQNNLEFGKTMNRFENFRRIAGRGMSGNPELKGAALVSPDGNVEQWAGGARDENAPPRRIVLPREAEPGKREIVHAQSSGYQFLAMPLSTPVLYSGQELSGEDKAALAGHFVLALDNEYLGRNIDPMFRQLVLMLAVGTAAAFALFFLGDRLIPRAGAHKDKAHRRVILLGILSLLVIQGATAVVYLRAVDRISHGGVRGSTRQAIVQIGEKLGRLMEQGIGLDEIEGINEYLRDTKRLTVGVSRIALRDGSGKELYASDADDGNTAPGQGDGSAREEDRILVPLSFVRKGESPYTLGADPDWRPLAADLRGNTLDVLSTLIISLLLLMEMLLLQACLVADAGDQEKRDARERGLLRAMAFFFLVAFDMTLSFIPLRMKELLTQGGFSGTADMELLLGLPISVEMIGASISMLLTGSWSARGSASRPLFIGLALTSAGYAASSLAEGMYSFIAARALCGLGYGFALMSLQHLVVTHSNGREQGKNVAVLFAGVYGGSLCGSAAGAMLADRFGYAGIFFSAALLLGALTVLCALWARFDAAKTPAPAIPVREAAPGVRPARSASWRAVFSFCNDPKVLAVMFCSLFPGALITVGLLNYFIPIFLNRSGVSQSDIGRVLTVYCLVFICLSPSIGKWVEQRSRKAPSIILAGLLGGACLLAFAVPVTILPPFWMAFCVVFLLGLSLSVSMPAQNSFILNAESAKALGHETAMSIYNTVERVGQVIGPLIFGQGMILFALGNFSIMSAAVFILLTGVFAAVALRREKECPSFY